MERKHTGAYRFRVGWFGRVILEYEEEVFTDTRPRDQAYSPGWWKRHVRWRSFPRGTLFVIDGADITVKD